MEEFHTDRARPALHERRLSVVDDAARCENLAKHAKHWRRRAGQPSLRAIWASGGPSPGTITKIEKAGSPAPGLTTLQKLDDVYGLAGGSSARALAGEDLLGAPVKFVAVLGLNASQAAQLRVSELGVQAHRRRAVMESLSDIAGLLPLGAKERRKVNELLKGARAQENALRELEHNPEVCLRLLTQIREDAAAVADIVIAGLPHRGA